MDSITFRPAGEDDCGLILSFIKGLAEYERMADEVVATEELLHRWLFEEKAANVLFAELAGKAVGFALYFYNFSTFLGRPGLYLEDLFVLPEYRGRGVGKALLQRLAAMAHERGCGRMEWVCLDWNEPSKDFYKALGARPVEGWTIFRLTGDGLAAMASEPDLP